MAVEARRGLAGRNPFPASGVTASVNVQHEIWWNSLSYRSPSPWDAVLQTRGVCRDAHSGGHLMSVDTYSTPRAVFFFSFLFLDMEHCSDSSAEARERANGRLLGLRKRPLAATRSR